MPQWMTGSPSTGEGPLTPNELINQADTKLFQAKHEGRNRVIA